MKITEALFAVCDTETSGLDPAKDELLEIGAVRINWRGKVVDTFEALVKPTRPLTADNSAIHGLIDEDFASAPTLYEVALRFNAWWGQDTWAEDDCFVFHNAAFDLGFLPMLHGRRTLCTKRAAMHLCKDAPNSKNQCLRYFFRDVARDPAIRALGDAHRALGDARVTAAILPQLLDRYFAQGGADDIDALIAFANAPVKMPSLPFGKHRGTPIAEVPHDYLYWLLREKRDMDADLRYTVEHTLGLKAVAS